MRWNSLLRAVSVTVCSIVLGTVHGSAFARGRAVRFLGELAGGTVPQLKSILSHDLLDLPYYASGIGMVLALRWLAYRKSGHAQRGLSGVSMAAFLGITAAIVVISSVLVLKHRPGGWPVFAGLLSVLGGCGAILAWLAATCWMIGRGAGSDQHGGAVLQASILWIARVVFVAASLRALDLEGENALWGVIPLGMLAAETVIIGSVVTVSALLVRWPSSANG